MARENLTKAANMDVTARQIDFVTRFSSNVKALMNILGVTRIETEKAGTDIRVLRGNVVLQSGSVGEGEEIPYSLASVDEVVIDKAVIDKYCKAVSAESIQKHGYAVAVQKTDNAFLNKLQNIVTNRFYTYLASGELTATEATFQMALSMAKGNVLDMFSGMDLDVSEVVGFVNTQDFYTYLGGADISVQTAFGMQYVKDFLGYRVVFLCDQKRVPRGKVFATPIENIIVMYVDPSQSDFAQAGLEFTTDGDTPFIGFHTEGNYRTLVSENTAIMGLYIFAEYINGVSVVTIEQGGSIKTVTGTSAAGTEVGDTKITVTSDAHVGGAKYYFKAAASTAPTAPTYLAYPDLSDWTALESGKDYTVTNGHKMTIIELNGAGQCVGASASITVVAKS